MQLTRKLAAFLGVFGLVGLFAACGSGGEVGDSCATEGDANECVDGAYCAKTAAGPLQCLKVCTQQSDCPTTTNCNGTTGTTKVCQPK